MGYLFVIIEANKRRLVNTLPLESFDSFDAVGPSKTRSSVSSILQTRLLQPRRYERRDGRTE
jgi:hypothetical protein